MSVKFTSVPSKTLAESITAAASSFRLNNIEGWDGTDLVSGDFGTQHFVIFRNANKTQVELMEIDPSTIASASITIVRRGLDFTGDLTTEVAANKLSWTKGDTYVDLGTDTPQMLQWLKEYIDAASIAGAVDASTTAKGIVEVATTAEIDAGTGTGGTGASLMPTPAGLAASIYGTRLPSAAEKTALGGSPSAPATGNKFVTQAKLVTAGETVSGATTPVPVYQNSTDFEFYACDANDTTKLRFVGFAITNGTDGNTMYVQMDGIVPGFTGLTRGVKYYVQDTAGTIGTSIGTYEILVGVAISTTEIAIVKGNHRIAGTTGALGTASGSTAVTTGFYPSVIRLRAVGVDNAQNNHMDAVWVNGVLTGSYSNQSGASGEAGNGAILYDGLVGSGNYMTFTITSVSATGFTITWTETGTFGVGGSNCIYEAEGDI